MGVILSSNSEIGFLIKFALNLHLGTLCSVEQKMNAMLRDNSLTRLTAIDVIFGCQGRAVVVNMILLVAKQFILRQRCQVGAITVDIFRHHLVKMFNIEKTNAYLSSKVENFAKNGSYSYQKQMHCYFEIEGDCDMSPWQSSYC